MTRGGKRTGVASVQQSEQPGADSGVRATEETSGGGGGGTGHLPDWQERSGHYC